MPKREDYEPRGGRQKPNKPNGGELARTPPPAERATSPPISVEGSPSPPISIENPTTPSLTIDPSASTSSISTSAFFDPLATVSPRESVMTTPNIFIDTTSPRATRTVDGRFSRRRDVLSVQPPTEIPDGFVAKSII